MRTEQSFVKEAVGRVRIVVVPGVNVAWARGVCGSHVRVGAARITVVPFPCDEGTREAVVKVYLRRHAHGFFRRLLASRAAREARGYAAFALHGIPAARLLFWGEERRFGLFCAGIVVTARVDAEPIHVVYAREPDERLLESAVDALAAIHRTGFCHGDPRLRNFLATRPVPMAIDLASWSPRGRRAHVRDLTRFLGSAAALTGAPEKTRALLERYALGGPALPCDAEAICSLANRYYREEGKP